ncbi:MAG: tRNA guanosine(34) transglycosylase Tgt, partial [Oscillospiraceae bacterium]|nr:tRNA guanosine(34) transglycosylase Tgt [Oscillospiraceae bacterium]
HIDGRAIFMGPEESMNIQSNLASTIAMAFDECVPNPSERNYVKESLSRTTRWLKRCIDRLTLLNQDENTLNKDQMLFGINQGSIYKDLRIEHAKVISDFNLPGYAIGGLAVGETHEVMYDVIEHVVPHLPLEKPVYLMGVGIPENILEAVDRGVDFFDCVLPARNGRHGHVFTDHGKINLLNKKYELDDAPIEENCKCPTCKSHTKAYIRHLFKAKEMLAMRLSVLHNLYFYNNMMEEIRNAIRGQYFQKYKSEKIYNWHQNK